MFFTLFLIGGTRNFPARFSTGPVAARPSRGRAYLKICDLSGLYRATGAAAADSDARGGPERADSEALFEPRRPAPPHHRQTHVRTRTRERRGRRTPHAVHTRTHEYARKGQRKVKRCWREGRAARGGGTPSRRVGGRERLAGPQYNNNILVRACRCLSAMKTLRAARVPAIIHCMNVL